jgi:hypothetical protein
MTRPLMEEPRTMAMLDLDRRQKFRWEAPTPRSPALLHLVGLRHGEVAAQSGLRSPGQLVERGRQAPSHWLVDRELIVALS